VASKARSRWWMAVAVVSVAAVAVWAGHGVGALRARHGTGSVPATGAANSTGRSSAASRAPALAAPEKILPRLLGGDTANARVVATAFTPDGKTLVAQLGTNVIQVRDAATGAVRFTTAPGGSPGRALLSAPAISPDGDVVAVGVSSYRDGTRVDLISLSTGKVTASVPVNAPEVHSVAFSPDGKTLAIGAGKSLFLTNLATRASVSVDTAQVSFTGDSTYVSFSADGKSLLVASSQGLVKIWDVRATGFARSLSLPAQGANAAVVEAAAIGPDGGTVAASGWLDGGNGETWLWNPRTGGVRMLPHTSPPNSGNSIWSQALSPDGTLLATGDGAGTIQLWNTATGRLVATAHAPSAIDMITAIAFSPDGASLVTAQSTDATVGQEDTAVIQLWGLRPASGQAARWASLPSGPSLALLDPEPGTYRVARTMETYKALVVTLDSVQVAGNGTATFVVTVENTGSQATEIGCTGASGAKITLATRQVINSSAISCLGFGQGADSLPQRLPPQEILKINTVFPSARGLAEPFTLTWDGPDGFHSTTSNVIL
jgi:WD40 repeat protein